MYKLVSLCYLLCTGCLLSACSDPNALLWHSLKNRDAIAHPDAESQPNSDRSITYEEYKQARQKLLKKQSNP